MKKAYEYRDKATQCDYRADTFDDAVIRAEFKDMARQWRQIAAQVEQLEFERGQHVADLSPFEKLKRTGAKLERTHAALDDAFRSTAFDVAKSKLARRRRESTNGKSRPRLMVVRG